VAKIPAVFSPITLSFDDEFESGGTRCKKRPQLIPPEETRDFQILSSVKLTPETFTVLTFPTPQTLYSVLLALIVKNS
jgi:hypothetical protein